MSCDCANTITSIAGELIDDLNNDSSLSASYLSSWLRNNIGKLNNVIGTSFTIGSDDEITPCINDDQKDIFKQLYICWYYQFKANSNLGASGYEVLEVRDGDSVVKVASKTEIAKTYLTIAKTCNENITFLIKYYNKYRALPKSMSAFDTNQYLYSRQDD